MTVEEFRNHCLKCSLQECCAEFRTTNVSFSDLNYAESKALFITKWLRKKRLAKLLEIGLNNEEEVGKNS